MTVDADRAETLPAGFARYERDLDGSPATFYAGLGHVERFPDYWELFGQHVDAELDRLPRRWRRKRPPSSTSACSTTASGWRRGCRAMSAASTTSS